MTTRFTTHTPHRIPRVYQPRQALAYLHGPALLRLLKAAPGLEVETPRGKGVRACA